MDDQVVNAVRQAEEAIVVFKAVRKGLAEVRELFGEVDPSVDQIEKKFPVLAEALGKDGVSTLVPEGGDAFRIFQDRLGQLKQSRSDVMRRREDLARLSVEGGIPCSHTGSSDYIGPFKIEHRETHSSLHFGKLVLQKISYPSGGNLLEAVRKWREKLDAEAKKGWLEFVEAAFAEQERLSTQEPVPWAKLVVAAIPNEKRRKQMKRSLLYRLSMMISSTAPGGWGVVCPPPTLPEMAEAWTVPVLNKANDTVKVYRVRLRKLAAHAVENE